jgi:hypothetical protein
MLITTTMAPTTRITKADETQTVASGLALVVEFTHMDGWPLAFKLLSLSHLYFVLNRIQLFFYRLS